MGIKGLLKLINENKDRVCSNSISIRGKLIVDGYGILHEIYEANSLEWASGGCYADQHRATTGFFEALIKAGVEPIVILDGGGCEFNLRDTIHRRNQNIQRLQEDLRKHHVEKEHSAYNSHHLPLLARQVYTTSLKQLEVPLYVADGKAHSTIVSLANHYDCPVLTNNTNYCVSSITGGVIISKHLDISTCKATIFKRTELVHFLGLRDPDLLFPIIAIMGDGYDTYVPFLYHGRIRTAIEISSQYSDIQLQGRSWVLNVADFLRDKNIKSFQDFQRRLGPLNFGGQCFALANSCKAVQEVYDLPSEILSIEILKTNTKIKCSKVGDFPKPILEHYRVGDYPVFVVNAIALGECTLDQNVGDASQPPVPYLGQPIRRVMYGLASDLISHKVRRCIKEYYRSNGEPWRYEPHSVSLISDKYQELSTDKIFDLDDTRKNELAKSAVCEILEAPANILLKFERASDHIYMLASITTYYWAQHLLRSSILPHPDQLVKALILNFFFNHEADQEVSSRDLYSDPMWIKVYHAILEWQSLYCNICSLNSMLCSPFLELPPTNILNGPFVMELALNPNSDIIILEYLKMIGPEKRELYALIIDIMNI